MSFQVQNGSVDTGAVTINGSNVPVIIDVSGHDGYLRLDLLAGAANISAFKITSCAVAGGVHQDWITDFTVNTLDMPFNNIGSGSPPIPASARRSIKLDMSGIAEVGLVATGTATSLRAQSSSIPSP